MATRVYKGDGYIVRGAFRGSREATYRKGEARGQLKCLARTVDPRGPKGK